MKKSKNNIFSKIKKKISSLLNRIKNIKPADAAVLAGVIALSGIIIVPSVVTCVVNYKRTSHEHHIYKMLSILVEKIEEENDITQGNSANHFTLTNKSGWMRREIYHNSGLVLLKHAVHQRLVRDGAADENMLHRACLCGLLHLAVGGRD